MVGVLTALALLAGCDRPSGTATPTQSVTPQANVEQVPHEPATPAAASPEELIAMQRLKAQWSPSLERAKGDAVTHLLQSRHELPGSKNGSRILLIYTSRFNYYSCNACHPDLSFFEFDIDPVTGKPTLIMASLKAARMGYADVAPEHWVQPMVGKRYAVVFHWTTQAQGIHRLLFILMPIKGRMREVFGEMIGSEYDRGSDEYNPTALLQTAHWKSIFRFQPGPGHYPDLHLERQFLESRKHLLDPRKGPFSEELTADGRVPTYLVYRFDGRRYRRVLAEQRPLRKNHEDWWDSDE